MTEMTNDQKRVSEVVLPLIERVVQTEDGASDATILNRAFAQGADPLFIMEMMGADFVVLCNDLEVAPDVARSAISKAHTMGPGIFCQGTTGFQVNWQETMLDDVGDWAVAWDSDEMEELKCEVVWLLLAGCSRLTEEPFGEDVPMAARLQNAIGCVHRAMQLTVAPDSISADEHLENLLNCAARVLAGFQLRTEFTVLTLENGTEVPMATVDEGFYMAYKAGHPAAAVRQGALTFFGTQPGTSLQEQGIEVHKEISPQFGIVFAEEAK